MLMFGQVLLFAKSQQFLTMIDAIAPLISIFIQIFKDIVGFMIILFIFMFSFSFAFYLIGQNQKDFDNIPEDKAADIPYGTFVDSISYVADILIGQTDQDSFNLGDGRMYNLLEIIFWMACFVIMIHLLNMLIAIMGNTFSEGNDNIE